MYVWGGGEQMYTLGGEGERERGGGGMFVDASNL
jgi:hypothetical protein